MTKPIDTRAKTLVEVLRARAEASPDRRAYTFLADGERDHRHLSWGELDTRARAIGALLQESTAPGERVVLLYPPGLDFIAGFLGCLYAGVVAVPAYPPGSQRQLPRLKTMIEDARPALALTTTAGLARFESLCARVPELRSLRWRQADDLPRGLADAWQPSVPDADQLAFLQYTSGSTALPKGVMVSHRNLMHNEEMMRRAFDQSPDSVVVGWLPLYHDMGLIGNVLQPLYVGAHCVLMAPLAFLHKPRRWLAAISRFRATTSGGPNFAYDLCVRKIPEEQRQGLDLSAWRVAFNGAEPVRAETLERFSRAFGPCGFRRRAFVPCYGLAEATLLVAAGSPDREPRVLTVDGSALERGEVVQAASGRELIASGRSGMGQRLILVDPVNARPCPAGGVGEIWVAGPSIAGGYWRRPEASRRDFAGRLPGAEEGAFLRTGDLGFLDGEELFVAGRLKDLIILRGRNIYPQDLEWAAEASHTALRPEGGAAFAVEVDGEEWPVVVFEIERRQEAEAPAAADAIRREVARHQAVRLYEALVVRAGSVPRTSSGKVRRRACRQAYLAGELKVLARASIAERQAGAGPLAAGLNRETLLAMAAAERRPALEEHVAGEIARVVRADRARVEPRRSLLALGLDSLAAVELQNRLESDFDVVLPSAHRLADSSFETLVAELVGELGETALPPAPALVAVGATGGEHPASPGQAALWFLDRLTPHSAVYNLTAAFRVRGDLDAEALSWALTALVARHGALRTTLTERGGRVWQRVSETPDLELSMVSGRGRDATWIREWEHAEAYRPFDLEQGPLLRVSVRLDPEGESRIVLAVHHCVADFWSLELLARELAVLYGHRIVAGEALKSADSIAVLPPPEVRYSDWVRFRAARLEGPDGDRLRRSWQARLAGVPRILELSPDRPRPPRQTFTGGRVRRVLGSERKTAIQHLAGRHDATLYVALLSVFAALLERYSGQRRFLIGSPTSGRSPAGVAGVAGYFVNPVAQVMDLSASPTVDQHLERTREAALEALADQEYPFSLLAARLAGERDASRSPLFQVMFVLQKAQRASEEALAGVALGWPGELRLGDLILRSEPLEERFTPFDLTLMAAELDSGIALSLSFNSDLFEATTAARMLSHFAALADAMVEAPGRGLNQLTWLRPAERAQLRWEWNDTGSAGPGESLIDLFEAQVARTPETVAVVGGAPEARLTYRALDRRAVALADRLRRLGVGREARVGLYLDRSPEMLAAMLAIWKAGGAYVPLDPGYPAERLAWMLADGGVRLVLSEPEWQPRLAGLGARVVCRDALFETPEPERPGPVRAVARYPRDLAYVIYTSGSTGRPKGVAIEQASAAVLARWAQRELSRRELAAVLASTSISFDLSVFELFVPLTVGGTVILARSVLELPALPAAAAVTLINTVPSAIRELLRLAAVPPSARTVNLAGEPLRRDLVERIQALGTVRRVLNLYGPSEDTTYSTVAEVRAEDGRQPTIGRAIAATRVHVLDSGLREVAPGVAGELVIAGAGLARGYLDRPRLTAEKFPPDPFADPPGQRVYLTGDSTRRSSDGRLEFLGRFDHQVKLRGFRIELGELEVALSAHPAVAEAVALLREDRPGDSRLVAYVVKAPGPGGVDASQLRRDLATQLPDYMLPSTIVELPALPLTPTGKIDRRALPAPVGPAGRSGSARIAPRTAIEEILAGVWSEILGRDEVGPEDNFFELGGHSLLATRVASRIRETVRTELPLPVLFEARTLAELAARVEQARREEDRDPAPPILPAATRAGSGGRFPLSFAQQRLWFLDRLEPGHAFYNVPVALRLRGKLDVAALAASFAEIVRRHEVLRTVFRSRQGRPIQMIQPPASGRRLAMVDLERPRRAGRAAELARLARAEATAPFDLAHDPLLRTTLVRLAEREHVLLTTCHHIVSDGWSLGVLLRELQAIYGAYTAGALSPLAELPVQYADFAVWQRARLAEGTGGLLARKLGRWRDRLAGAPSLELATDRPRPAVVSYRGRSLSFRGPRALFDRLRRLSQARGGTLFMTLMAAFQTLLARLSGQDDICVGTPVAHRDRSETEELIGFFANTLVLRGDLSSDPPWSDVFERIREAALQAYQDQDLPFERLVEELEVERDLSRTPLFQAMLALQNAPLSELSLPGLALERLAVETGTAKFDLTLELHESRAASAGEEGFPVSLEYSTDLFDETTVVRLWHQLTHLLAAVVDDPRRRISELTVLAPSERHQLLEEWNGLDPRDLAGPVAASGCVHHFFEAQVARTPDAVAVVAPGDAAGASPAALSYRVLQARAESLARRLRKLGVGPDARVAIYLERSPWMMVAVLAALKAGGAYVPLDPGYPSDRLSWMLADARPAVLLTEAGLEGRLAASRWAGRVLLLDDDGVDSEPLGSADERREARAANLAYVIYTSGSTGWPKGVSMPHDVLVRLIDWQLRESRAAAGTVTAQFAAFSFDVAFQEMFSTWASGGTLAVVGDRPRQDPDALWQLCDRLRIERLFLPPVALRHLAEISARRRPLAVREIMAAGEQLLVTPAVEELLESLGGCRLFNHYGPAECHAVTQQRVVEGTSPPIGRPISSSRAYLLDGALGPVPIGAVGELYLGGRAVGRGYHRRPAWTAERFLPDLHARRPGSPVYRTGDRARYLALGELEFLGRADNQVKLRGFRIEPGEIEAVLAGHPAVRGAAVVLRQGRGGERRLVAYVVAEAGRDPQASELRDHLAASLPDYMVPAACVLLAALPLTPSGKVDRRTLAERELPETEGEGGATVATPTEELLAGIWSEVLDPGEVRADSHFFALGGHSLLATQVMARIRSTFGIELALRELFETPTLRDLAARIEAVRSGEARLEMPPIAARHEPEGSELPLSPAQERMWFLDRFEPGNVAYNLCVPVRLRGPLDAAVLDAALRAIGRRHQSLRTAFIVRAGKPYQRVEADLRIGLPVIDLERLVEPLRGVESARQIAREASTPFDLTRAPLWRSRLLRLGSGEHVLLLSMHHTVSDGWSIQILLRELSTHYRHLCGDGAPATPLPPLPIQYSDYARWQRQALASGPRDSQLGYWRARLEGAPTRLEMPLDRPRPAAQTFVGGRSSMVLDEGLSDALRALGRRRGATLFMTLLAVFKILLSRLAGQSEVVVGTPVAGRQRQETEGLIGLFLNTLAVRTDLSPEPDASEAPPLTEILHRVREGVLQDFAHQQVPFEWLLEELRPERELSHTPLFQVLFNMLSLPGEDFGLPAGLTMELVAQPELPSKFDLTLYVRERAGEIALDLVYNADLFGRVRMDELLVQYEHLLGQAVAAPERRIDRLDLRTPRVRELLAGPAEAAGDEFPGTVHELFVRQARRHADRPAIVDTHGTWSYGELERLTRRAALALRERGVGRGDRVAIHARRGASLVVAMLGVLRAEAVYVILDPAHPAKRLAAAVERARLRAFMVLDAAAPVSPELDKAASELPRVLLGGERVLVAEPEVGLPEGDVGPDDPACLGFTSGSTGVPRGILGRHGSLSAFLPWHGRRFGDFRRDRFSMLSGLAHDPLQRDVFTPLATGGAVVIPDAEDLEHAGRLAPWLVRQRVTVANLTPALGQMVTASPRGGAAEAMSLRLVFFVGEALTRGDVERLRRIAPRVQVVNYYGTTETQRAMGYHLVDQAAGRPPGEILPLGRGIQGVQLLVLNAASEPAGIGEVGEIHFRSSQLALGYFADPALTAARFIPDHGGERLYRSGDLGRYLPDGEVAFAGRADQQVQIRGFRVETGEIEAALGQLAAVRQAAVVIPGGVSARLVAYVVLDVEASHHQVREALRQRLPEYMVPSTFVALAELPLTPSRKVDRRALRSRGLPAADAAATEAFGTPGEELLAEIWKEVLGTDGVTPGTNFFELGGHSLSAIQVASRIRDVFAVDLPLRTLFEAPTLRRLAARIAGVAGDRSAAPPIRAARRHGGERLPLSFAQERLWLLDRLEPGNPAFNMFAALRLLGDLKIPVLQAAIGEIVRRHEVLRTAFITRDGRPWQRVLPAWSVTLPCLDLAGLDPADRDSEQARLIAGEEARPFDLRRAPLWRLRLLRLARNEHVLCVTLHHIASDEWSFLILQREISALYGALSGADGPSPLVELPVQYADYAHWQAEALSSGVRDIQLAYWRQQLADPPDLELPTDLPRPAVQTFSGGRLSTVLAPDLSVALRRLGRRFDASLFMVLLACFKVLLSRLSGQRDVLVGTPVAGRNRREIEGLIGIFLNNLVLRTELSGDPSFGEILKRVRETVLMAFSHQDVPFEWLLEELQPERDLSRTPLFQVFFNMLSLPLERDRLPGLSMELLGTPEARSKFDLTLYVREAGAEIDLVLVYNADLFGAARMTELLAQYEHLLHQVVASPERGTDALNLRTAAARAVSAQTSGNATQRGPIWRASAHELFLRRAEEDPARLALIDGGGRWTYGELAEASGRLASALRQRGIGRGDRVVIYAHRGAELVAGLVGILRSGAAFVVLDPAHPAHRLAEITRRVRAAAWLVCEAAGPPPATVRAALEDLPGIELGRTLAAWMRSLPPTGRRFLGPEMAPQDLAYVAFTSGSTGRPKGVLGNHVSLTHFAAWQGRTFDLGPSDRFTMLSGLAHDPLLRDVFSPLLLGASLAIPDHEDLERAGQLAEWLDRQAVTVTHMTPAVGRLLSLPSAGEARLDGLRFAFFGGDVLTRGDVERLEHLAPRARCVNLYGTTETQRALGYHEVAPEATRDSGPEAFPLGRGVDGTELRVLRRGRRAGIGEVGEIHMLGPLIAQGYLDDPRLSAERFVPAPDGGRLYRTGDLGRYRPDGQVSLAGRADQQVQIRGFRVEPGEIAAVLERHPEVLEAAVLARRASSGERGDLQLVAWWVPAGEGAAADELRSFLSQRLPRYMVPSLFVPLSSLPMLPSGKLDPKALASLPAARESGGIAADEALWRRPEDELVAGIWQDVLSAGGRREVPEISAGDNFFELGGHSLLATQVQSRLRAVFGVELSLARLFAAPTVAELAAAVVAARPAPDGAVVPPIRARDRRGEQPLSFAQERLWLLDQLEPGRSTYNIPASMVLSGGLDVAALAATLDEIVRRHEVLRTTFPSRDGRPVQRVTPPFRTALPQVDLSRLAPREKHRALTRLAAAEARRPFDLERGPLVRALLVRLAESAPERGDASAEDGSARVEEHALLTVLHHIVSDGWSTEVLIRELAALYDAHARRVPSPLAELRIQYADFAGWQREWLREGALESQLAYWRQRLAGAPAALELPTDRPRPAVASGRGARLAWRLEPELSEALQALSRRTGTTLFMTLLAAFQALLSRLTGQSDVMVGSAVAGRNRVEIEGLIGFFVNTLVLRSRLIDDPSFQELLAQVRTVTLEAFAHQELPFERLVEELQPERDASRPPLVQAAFNLQNASRGRLALTGLSLRPIPMETGTAKFDLLLTARQTRSGLAGSLEYASELFDTTTIFRLVRRWRLLLERLQADPDRRVSTIDLLAGVERHQLISEWNDTASAFPDRQSLQQLFEIWVRRTPDAIAVAAGDRRTTYAELDRRANRLARRLMDLGIGPGSAVGLQLERSREFALAMLAVIKAGGVYVPLDPGYPSERLRWMVKDAELVAVVTRQDLPRSWGGSSDGGPAVITMDGDGASSGRWSARALPLRGGPEAPAYVIYTSGSTGRPKGITVPHRAVARLVLETDYIDLSPADRVAHVSNVSFDAATFELWGALLTGGCLTIIPPDEVLSPSAFADQLRRHRITVLFVTTALFNEVVRQAPEAFSALRYVLFGGEAVDPQWPRRLLEGFAPEPRFRGRLLHVYGPTECTTFATWHRVRRVPAEARTIPIGRSLANTSSYTLDQRLQPVAVGMVGELVLAGPGLARGYLERRSATVRRFVPDAIAGQPGGRLYRTGDLVRQLPNGGIEFLGRVDHQVKLRGFRIELGEIEALLASHPGVEETVVVVHTLGPGDSRLVAYLVPRSGPAPASRRDRARVTASDVRAFLHGRLPDYMVPSVFVELSTLPLNPNGKVDRAALPPPNWEVEVAADAVPATPVEELLTEIWADVLGHERVGVGEDFFELGGHSLLATRVVARIRTTFGIELSLPEVFDAPTVRGIASRIEALRGGGEPASPIPVRPRDGREFPLSFAQERLWLLDRLDPGNAALNIFTALRLRGDLVVSALEAAFLEIGRRHEMLRTSFDERYGRPRQRISSDLQVELPLIDLSRLGPLCREHELERRMTLEISAPFDLGRAPLLRLRLVRIARDEHILLLTMHHIASDGTSLLVIQQEVSAFYTLRVGDGAHEVSLPAELAVQYPDYARWQRETLGRHVRDTQLAYWHAQLANLPTLQLPVDHPRPAVQTFSGERASIVLTPELSAELRSLARGHGATLFMVLLAYFQVLLARLSGQRDIPVGTPIAGRHRQELEGLIGIFLNNLVLRGDLSGNPDAPTLLARVRKTVLQAFDHQEAPFEWLLEELQPERDLGRTPLFQVFFNMLSLPLQSRELPGLTLEFLKPPEARSKFDLTLYVREAGGEIALDLVYNADLFSAPRMAELLIQHRRLLRQAAADPRRGIEELDLLTSSARRILAEVPVPHPAWQGAAHELFARRARRRPDRLAVIDHHDRWTYGELEHVSRRLAGALIDAQLGRGDRVLIYADRGAPLVAAILGVLRSGAAFVILDPVYPGERLLEMARQARPRAWIALAAAGPPPAVLAETTARLPGWRLGKDRSGCVRDLPPVADNNPNVAITPEDLAYIAFTSGSTGVPKGVLGHHGSLIRFAAWQRRTFDLGPKDRFTMLSGLGHDPLLRDIFSPLLIGAGLAVPGRRDFEHAGRLAHWVDLHGVTVTHLTPAMGRLLSVPARQSELRLRSLRFAFFAGDALRRADIERLRRLAPDARCVNLYGTTETQRALGYSPVLDERDGAAALSLGKGVEGAQLMVLGPRGVGAGIGELGEIHVRSADLAQGYLGDPARTAERFLPDDGGFRRYRTGDLGRYVPDGSVIFVGRADQQVQVRGFRIEPREIEMALERHPAVQAATVTARPLASQGGAKDLFLVAWMATGGEEVPVTQLRDVLRRRLPEYMLPSVFVSLAVLPLLPSGKVDRGALARRALPRQVPESAASESERRLLQGPVEALVAEIWKEVLGAGIFGEDDISGEDDATDVELGGEDNFFELGGHSVLAAQVLARLREAFGLDLSLRALFEAPTIRTLAELIDQERTPADRETMQGAEAGIVIAASFPAETVAVTVRFWLAELEFQASVKLSGDRRLLPDLLAPMSDMGRNRRGGLNVLLVSFEDWLPGSEPRGGRLAAHEATLERRLNELILGLRDASRRVQARHLILLCQPSAAVLADPEDALLCQRLGADLATRLEELSGVDLMTPEELAVFYPAPDPGPAEESYPAAYLTALGTMVARRFHALQTPSPQAIVLDCDRTLWRGRGHLDEVEVEVDSGHRALQELLVSQHRAGIPLFLCGQGADGSMLEVFERGPDMPLRREHFAGWRLDHRPMSETLKSLAAELDFSLERVIFVAGDSAACAQVQRACPEVVVVELPPAGEDMSSFLRNTWVFDRWQSDGDR